MHAVRKLLAVPALSLLAVLIHPIAANAKDTTVTITGVVEGTAMLSPGAVSINQGDTVTFDNKSTTDYTICLSATDTSFITAIKGKKTQTPPLGQDSIGDYYLSNADCSAAPAAHGTIDVGPPPTTATTTTTTAPTTTTTAKPTTTTAKSTTTTSTTTSSTTSTTTSTVPGSVVASSDDGGSSALPLALAAILVAALAAGAYYLWRRSQQPPYDEPPGWDQPPGGPGWNDPPPPGGGGSGGWNDPPPPTVQGPSL